MLTVGFMITENYEREWDEKTASIEESLVTAQHQSYA